MDEAKQTHQPEALATESAGHRPKIVAAVPCFNEERFIGSVVAKLNKFVDEVIVIDDGSIDGTVEVASEIGATVYSHSRNLGYGAAIRSALLKGAELRADVLVILDGDGQHDPRDIPNLVKPLLDGEADVVVGSRFLGKGKKPPLYRRLGQRVLTATTNMGSGCKVSDSQSGFRAFSSRALKVLNLSESGMAASSEMLFAMGKSGLRTVEVSIDVSYTHKAKRSPIGHGMSVLSRLVVLISIQQPLLLLGLPGLALLVGGLVLGTRVLAIYGATRELATGNALVAVLLSLAGLLALVASVMLQAMKELLRGLATQLAREVTGYERNGDRNERSHRTSSEDPA